MTHFEALSLIAQKTADPKLRRILESGAAAAQNGEPFSATMSRYPAVFPPHQIAIVQASEQAGRMEAACEALSRHLEAEIEVRREMRMATLYPKIAMAISLLLVSIIANAPLLAKALSSGTYGTDQLLLFWLLMRVFVIIGGALLFFFVAFKLMLQNPSLRLSYDAFKLALPVFGPLLKSAEFMLFGRSLAALLRSGVEVGTAVEVSAATVSNWHFRQSLATSVQLVRSGRPLSDALEPTGLFSGLAIGMIRTGERAGKVDEAIEKTCEYLEGESRSRMKNAAVWVYVLALLAYFLVAGYFVIKFWTGMAGGLTNITE
jgi:type II secretory pathway component PulF